VSGQDFPTLTVTNSNDYNGIAFPIANWVPHQPIEGDGETSTTLDTANTFTNSVGMASLLLILGLLFIEDSKSSHQ